MRLTKLSKQIVFNYIKNFCYSPIYDIVQDYITYATDLSEYQFSMDTYYIPGAYCSNGGKLYQVLKAGSGVWAGDSIANIYVGEDIRVGETNLTMNNQSADYDPTRFKLVDQSVAIF